MVRLCLLGMVEGSLNTLQTEDTGALQKVPRLDLLPVWQVMWWQMVVVADGSGGLA